MREYSNVDPVVIRRLAEIIGKLNPVELVTPTNVAEEKARWCKIAKNGFYTSPYFSYDRTALKEVAGYSNELKTGKNHISSKFVPESPAEKVILDILLSRIDSAIACTEIAASILLSDDTTTNELCHRLYGHPSNTQAVEAYQIVTKELERETVASRFTEEEQKALKAQKFDAIQIGYWFTEIINKYGIEGWTVEVGDQYTSIDVRDKKQQRQTRCRHPYQERGKWPEAPRACRPRTRMPPARQRKLQSARGADSRQRFPVGTPLRRHR